MPKFFRHYFFGLLSLTFVYCIREVQSPKHYLPLRDVMQCKANVNQERKHGEIIKYMRYPTLIPNETNELTSARTRTLSF